LSAAVSVDDYIANWRYHDTERHCWHLVQAVWLDLTGFDIGDRTPAQDGPLARNRAFLRGAKGFHAVAPQTEPSIVLMSPVHRSGPHVGVYLRGRVLHLDGAGCHYQRVADIKRNHKIDGWYIP